ncbi:MAG: hypothetical protein VX193_01355 [Candidatus Thermoplasmatota archaeon]|nr:hypothetical protein [Candidatus Thermoplasmatota archaeon]
MSDDMTLALTMFTVGFAIVMFGMGALVAYYGSKKTRSAGFAFIFIGAVATWYWNTQSAVGGAWAEVVMLDSLLAVAGGFAGAIVGVIIFLVAIIKS